jgi:hypothetical protein
MAVKPETVRMSSPSSTVVTLRRKTLPDAQPDDDWKEF